MLAYIIRRVLYAIPILIGVNLITFALFFVVNTPDDMARMQLGAKRVTPEAIEKWKEERGYDKPLFFNGEAPGAAKLTDTIFFEKSVQAVRLRLRPRRGQARHRPRDPHAHVAEPRARASRCSSSGWRSTSPSRCCMAFFRATYLDFWGVVLCVAMMSISHAVLHHRRPVPDLASSGTWCRSRATTAALDAAKFLVLPVIDRRGRRHRRRARAGTARCSSRR